MSTDYEPDGLTRLPIPVVEPKPRTKNYPICPQCGCNTIVLFAPPKMEVFNDLKRRYKLMGTAEYVDWDKAHLYCCNGATNCDVVIPIMTGLTTPVKEDRYRFGER